MDTSEAQTRQAERAEADREHAILLAALRVEEDRDAEEYAREARAASDARWYRLINEDRAELDALEYSLLPGEDARATAVNELRAVAAATLVVERAVADYALGTAAIEERATRDAETRRTVAARRSEHDRKYKERLDTIRATHDSLICVSRQRNATASESLETSGREAYAIRQTDREVGREVVDRDSSECVVA